MSKKTVQSELKNVINATEEELINLLFPNSNCTIVWRSWIANILRANGYRYIKHKTVKLLIEMKIISISNNPINKKGQAKNVFYLKCI
jgi:hypothetical protein